MTPETSLVHAYLDTHPETRSAVNGTLLGNFTHDLADKHLTPMIDCPASLSRPSHTRVITRLSSCVPAQPPGCPLAIQPGRRLTVGRDSTSCTFYRVHRQSRIDASGFDSTPQLMG
jgi:hypothetical protein